MSIDAKRERDLRRQIKRSIRHLHRDDAIARLCNLCTQLLLLPCVGGSKGIGIALVGDPPTDDLDAGLRCGLPRNRNRERKAVKQLRTNVPLLGIHRPDEHEARGMRIGNPLALDGIHAHRRRVEENVHNVILEQIDLIHIEDIAVRRRQNPRLELLAPVLNRRLHIERTDHAILGRTDGQLHHAHRHLLCGDRALLRAPTTGIAVELGDGWIAVTGTALHRLQMWQECGCGADGGGFRRALLPLDQHTAKCGHDDAEEERSLHLLLSDNRRKRIYCFRFHSCNPCFYLDVASLIAARLSAHSAVQMACSPAMRA